MGNVGLKGKGGHRKRLKKRKKKNAKQQKVNTKGLIWICYGTSSGSSKEILYNRLQEIEN